MSETTTEAQIEETVAEAPAAAPAQEATAPDLTVQDLNALKAIIDVASTRGAFKPNEMVTVGQAYNKLENFLAAVAKTQPAQGA